MTGKAHRLASALATAVATVSLAEQLRPRGVVQRVGDGVAFIAGLPGVRYEEMLAFDAGGLGMAYDLGPEGVGALLLAAPRQVRQGEGVVGLGRLPEVPVGAATLGRVMDPLGHPLDEGPPIAPAERLPLFRPAPEIPERRNVDTPLATGVLAIDAAIPIGRGQRELIIGDRNVGKTSLALDVVAAQVPGEVAAVYVVIGQPMSRVLEIRSTLERAGRLGNTALIAAQAAASPGLQYLAPYAGASVAEWFRERGQDALVVYDDLTKHADAYRELALLLDRPPGREAYPGDIFHIHAELLERAAVLAQDRGGGSVTALPLAETTDGDISTYIPTNLISITDGQMYLDTGRWERGQRPAIDIGRSVSRIGAKAQPPALRAVARNLRIQLARFESLERLARVGLDMDIATRKSLAQGSTLRTLLRQGRMAPRGYAEQVLALAAVSEGWLGDLAPWQAPFLVAALVELARRELPELTASLEKGQLPATGWPEAVADLVPRARQAVPEARP
ncbi:MAG: F0F1 ATP synthase subunit alpha [Thermodesulfobacteriota bacterium]